MILKCYICPESENIRQIVTEDFKSEKLVFKNSEDLESSFSIEHCANLFNRKEIKVFTNVEDIDSKELTQVLDTSPLKYIWCFKTLRSNTNIYKKIKGLTSIEAIEPLKYLNNRKQSLDTFYSGLNLKDRRLYKILLTNASESRSIIRSEVEKCFKAMEFVEGEEIYKVPCRFNADDDIFVFIDHLLENNSILAYDYALKVEESTNLFALRSLLLRSIFFLITLVSANSSAKIVINAPPFIVTKRLKLAKELGIKRLLTFYNYIYNRLDGYPENSSACIFLTELVRFRALNL